MLMEYPGNLTHQNILKNLMPVFESDPNIEAFIIFGSMVRGNWDRYSDLDLDAIVKDDGIDIVQKHFDKMLYALRNANLNVSDSFSEYPNEYVIILDSLDRISIRFHTVEDTHLAILSSMQILCGCLTKEDIITKSKRKPKENDIEILHHKFLEHSIYVPLSLKRNKPINAQFFLNKMRQTIIQIYVFSRGIQREFEFEDIASADLKNELYKTYATSDTNSIQNAFKKFVKLYLDNLDEISNHKLSLSGSQKQILNLVTA